MRFQERPKKNMIQLQPFMISTLFWRKKTITVQEDGLVRFSVNRNRYEFQIYDPVTFFTTQKSKVKVYFDERNLSEIHLFDTENRFMGTVEPRLEFDGSNPDVIKKHRKNRRAIDKYAKDQKTEWERGVNKNRTESKSTLPSFTFNDDLLSDDQSELEQNLFENINGISSKYKFGML